MLNALTFAAPAGRRAAVVLSLCLSFGLQAAQAQPARMPHQLIGRLGVDIRKILEDPKASATPEDAERAVAEQIRALIARSPGHLSLTATDARGRTPLMLAVSGGYAQVVQALLADPAVRLSINVPDARGETAWMLANFAPAVTLAACQPATLTVARYPLVPPYVRRMVHVLKQQPSPIDTIVHDLEAAGAQADQEAAKQAWLARCHNAAPETREALAQGELLETLVRDALARQREFNKTAADNPSMLPQKPPADMKFVKDRDDMPTGRAPPLLRISEMRCESQPKPELPNIINWSGKILLKVVAASRAGVVETADFTVLAGTTEKRVIEAFSTLVVRTLAKYQCEGDQVFSQEFEFRIQ
ncbi:ankyrin repeat domain-containing protein [Roseateles sp.]|uniref:ankyrin repeat domain-containing protein n=1 Tax=Roseateles sp. TaxID=1971397 RepID=UPI0039EAECD2